VKDATIDTRFDASMVKGGAADGDGKGSPLFWIMHEIAKGLTWLGGMYLDLKQASAEGFSAGFWRGGEAALSMAPLG
jgi:hypothetical protein